ncbi:alpha/beta hydrolase [Methylocystis sp. L43]|jgi:esterase/lipase superfamily enzyme|nr:MULTISPECIES: alpha/beta hydrolase [unclassified Methylocystis]MBG0799018.1 alpha/beta hydrolase [Methylocystis sp. L43]MBG0806606.1 alpha/beta hydrolase [Methylocystis sp. H15]
MGRGRIILAALLALAFSACSSRPHGTLVATHQVAPGASVVDLLVVTTREPDQSEPGVMFSGERGHGVHFADIAVSIPPDANRAVGDVQWPQAPTPDPATQFTTVHADVLSREAALAAFNARIRKTPRRQVLVFVHGFNTRFEEAVYRFAQIVHDSRADVTPVLFTWPSRGRLLQYGYDHESASYSRDALELVLQALQRDRDVGEISILAHSMGNWVTLEALRQMAIRNGQIGSKIQNVMLASPDVDFDVFRRQIAEIGGVRPSIFTLFASRDDDALAASRRFWGNTRLGAVDPKASPYQEVLDRDRVKVVDLTGIATSDPLEHSKFASSPQVVRSIGARLAQGQPLRDGQAGIGDHLGIATAGAVSAVGGVAGAAVAAPFAIVDPATRENLSEHLGAAGQKLDPQY